MRSLEVQVVRPFVLKQKLKFCKHVDDFFETKIDLLVMFEVKVSKNGFLTRNLSF